jgi:hypothetical protein
VISISLRVGKGFLINALISFTNQMFTMYVFLDNKERVFGFLDFSALSTVLIEYI